MTDCKPSVLFLWIQSRETFENRIKYYPSPMRLLQGIGTENLSCRRRCFLVIKLRNSFPPSAFLPCLSISQQHYFAASARLTLILLFYFSILRYSKQCGARWESLSACCLYSSARPLPNSMIRLFLGTRHPLREATILCQIHLSGSKK